jgi:cytochrome c biogenesis protein CcdA
MMNKVLGMAAIALLLSLSSLPGSNSFYILSSSSCEPCVSRLRVVKELYPDGDFVVYDIADAVNLNRFSEIEKVIDAPFMPLPIFGMFSDGELRLVAAGGLSRGAWEKIAMNETSGVNVYVDNGKGEAVLEKNIGDDTKIARLEELFLGGEVYSSVDGVGVSLVLILTAALVDAFNPCMLGFFLVFLAFVSYSGDPENAIGTSLAFSVAVFVTRLIMGVCFMQVLWISSQIRFLAAVVALVLGAVKIFRFLLGERRQIPVGFVDQITRHIERASNPKTGFVAGCVTSFLITSCSSPPYFLALSLLSTGSDVVGGLASLLIYNLVVVAPLLTLVICVYVLNLTTTTDLRLWVSTRRRYIDLLIGLGLTIISVFVIFYQAQFLG